MLFIDVSGFTRMTQKASGEYYGVEIITGVLNRYFELLGELIYNFGGEILKYGGDACLSFFPNQKDAHQMQEFCAKILKLCQRLSREFKGKYGFGFKVHGAWGFGSLMLNIVGDSRYHLDYYVDSPLLSAVYQAADTAKDGELLQVKHTCAYTEASCPVYDAKELSPAGFLPAVIQERMKHEGSIAELKNACIIFVHLKPETGQLLDTKEFQKLFVPLQRWVYEYDGVINKIDYSDKGYLILIAFGVPFVHTDDIERGFLCALRIRQLASAGLTLRIGITYSNIFSGLLGSSRRYEYGIIGNGVNVAARLMSSVSHGEIALSREIIPRISTRFETAFLGEAQVKGLSEPLGIYQLKAEHPEHWPQMQKQFQGLLPLGLKQLPANYLDFTKEKSGSLTLISAPAGCGKSYLIWHLAEVLKNSGANVEIIAADEINRNFRLEFVFNLLRRKLEIQSFAREFDHFGLWCENNGIPIDLPMLKEYLLPGSSAGKEKIAAAQLSIVENALILICQKLLAPYQALFLDNFHFFDAESRNLILKLSPLLIKSGTKLIYSLEDAADFADLKPVHLQLKPYSLSLSTEYLHQLFPNITENAIQSLHTLSEGNPRFLNLLTQELLRHISTPKDLITAESIQDLSARGFIPDRLENLLLTEFQTLSQPQQELLKYLCIYKLRFSTSELMEAFAYQDYEYLQNSLEALSESGHIQQVDFSPEIVYAFSSPLLQESIYRSILLGEKRKLHLEVAERAAQKPDATQKLDLISYHYVQAQDKAGIKRWCILAAESYKNAGAYDASRRQYQHVLRHFRQKELRQEMRLNIVELDLLQADNLAAGKELKKLKRSLQRGGEAWEKYVFLQGRYLNNTADFPAMRDFLAANLPAKINNPLRKRIYIEYLEALQNTHAVEEFQALALDFYQKLSGDSASKNYLSGSIAQFFLNQGEYDLAADYYKRKIHCAKKLSDSIGIRIGTLGWGNALARMGKKAAALKRYQESIALAERIGDRNGYSKGTLDLGAYLRNLGDFGAAIQAYEKSLLIAEHTGNRLLESIILYDIGELKIYEDKLDEAFPYFQASLKIAKEIGDKGGESFCYDAIGDYWFKNGDYARAEKIYRQNEKLQIDINDQEGLAHTWGNLGNCAKMKRDFELARSFYQKQFELLSKVQDWDGVGRATFNQAMLFIEENRLDSARDLLLKAKAYFEKVDAQYYIQICDEQLAGLAEARR